MHQNCVRRLWVLGSGFGVWDLGSVLVEGLDSARILKGSWDLVTRVIIRVTILITTIEALITLLSKSHDPPSIDSSELNQAGAQLGRRGREM